EKAGEFQWHKQQTNQTQVCPTITALTNYPPLTHPIITGLTAFGDKAKNDCLEIIFL
ncbi:uncharacterized protein V6R79_017873, partial [Siganus canaliculatus]